MSNRRRPRSRSTVVPAPASGPPCMFVGKEPGCERVAVRGGLCSACEDRVRAEQLQRRAAAPREGHGPGEEPSPRPARSAPAPASVAPAAAPLAPVLADLQRARARQARWEREVYALIVQAVDDGQSYGAIGAALGVTRQAVRQRHLRGL